MYLDFISLLHIDMAQVIEILHHIRQAADDFATQGARASEIMILAVEQINSLRPSDAYMRQQPSHHWFR